MATLAAAVTLGLAPAAQAAPARAENLDGVWSCSVPQGYTYDQVVSRLGSCGQGFAPQYHLRAPQDGIWACSVPDSSFTWDQVVSRVNTCSTSGFAVSYHMRVPVNGLWACTVPPGFVYDQAVSRVSTCSTSGFAYSYHLRG
ncbi:hypothetical protein HG542_16100 [Streptomyces morookaense]|uniref:Secreted protein n=1 Tax=Streptomyces morookaense TaxID=1970 RepID=A0A7Y7B567_STRMO|nr:hypothetical protein [Streptomyces morookaense]